eukprot:TRINITY_DN76506_c0_g1_i1.p1 TRINITY_DN76506_c0_g1~~TRINITY_DN76506_c0_g1_i1.p1  ORF type:complete len:145 (-),score=18.40 TRINITY_DN76506_c0_g1_i1:387-821(-)
MSKGKKPKYENMQNQYKPPTPEVFGNSAPVDLPTYAPKVQNFNVDRPRHRPKLADRLAVYEDDDPKCQRYLCYGGFLIFPLWWIGTCLYFTTPSTKVLTREAGFKNLVLTLLSAALLAAGGLYHMWSLRQAAAGTGVAAPTAPP